MILILAYDGLEYNYVGEFNLKGLMQKDFGKTDISEFSEPRTMVLWSSFLAGKNLEKRILKLKNIWKFKLKPKETFFKHFKKWKAIDVPGLTHKEEEHELERKLLKMYFEENLSIKEYDKIVFEHHKENKEEFFKSLEEDYEIIMAYFPLADLIGHLSFGLKSKMRLVYKELESIAKKVEADFKLIISDHGMKAVGRYGDHSNYGFWSTNKKLGTKNPKITDFATLILNFSK